MRFYIFVFFLVATCISCDEDECTKIVAIPQGYFSGGQFYTYDIEQEVPCDFPEPEDVVIIDPPELENFTYEIITLRFTTNTDNNTRRTEVEIQLNNPNEFDAQGIVIASLDIGGNTIVTGPFFQNTATSNCSTISANSPCLFKVDIQESLDIVSPDYSFDIVDIKYYLISE